MLEIKDKYADIRKTKVVKGGVFEFEQEDLIPNEKTIVALTTSNYIKRVGHQTYRSQVRGGKGIIGMTTREEDVVEHLLSTNTHDNMLFFTNKGRVFQSKVYDIPVGQRTAKGQAIVNLIQLAPGEKVTALINIPKFEDISGYLLMATKKGLVKKTAIDDFKVARKSGLIAIRLDSGDELKWVKITSGEDEILLVTKEGKAIRFNESEARPMGRATRGVRGIKLSKTDQAQGMDIVKKGGEVLIIMENGYGKRTSVGLFTKHHRAGSGIKAAAITRKTGQIVDMRVIIDDRGDLAAISEKGQVIRTPMSSISRIGRATQGVRIMRLNAGDKVTSIASIKVEKIEDRKENEEQSLTNTDSKEEPDVDKKEIAKRIEIEKKSISKTVSKKVVKKTVQKIWKKKAEKAVMKLKSKKAVKKVAKKIKKSLKKKTKKIPKKKMLKLKSKKVKVKKKDKKTDKKFVKKGTKLKTKNR